MHILHITHLIHDNKSRCTHLIKLLKAERRKQAKTGNGIPLSREKDLELDDVVVPDSDDDSDNDSCRDYKTGSIIGENKSNVDIVKEHVLEMKREVAKEEEIVSLLELASETIDMGNDFHQLELVGFNATGELAYSIVYGLVTFYAYIFTVMYGTELSV